MHHHVAHRCAYDSAVVDACVVLLAAGGATHDGVCHVCTREVTRQRQRQRQIFPKDVWESVPEFYPIVVQYTDTVPGPIFVSLTLSYKFGKMNVRVGAITIVRQSSGRMISRMASLRGPKRNVRVLPNTPTDDLFSTSKGLHDVVAPAKPEGGTHIDVAGGGA